MPDTLKLRLLKYVAAYPGCSFPQITAALQITRMRASGVVGQAYVDGDLAREGRRRQYKYRLSIAAQQRLGLRVPASIFHLAGTT